MGGLVENGGNPEIFKLMANDTYLLARKNWKVQEISLKYLIIQ